MQIHPFPNRKACLLATALPLTLGAMIGAPTLALAQQYADDPANAHSTRQTSQGAPDLAHGTGHHDHDNEIIVTAARKRASDVVGGVSVLDGAKLAEQVRTSLGDTLAGLPGVSSTSFGPTASRPVLRGLGGDRIALLTDGIGSLDLSSASADHAVAINPLTAQRIEILRGPSSLLYGSSAIGGVINVIDRRIPRNLPETPFHAEAIATYGSAANERSGNLSLDVPLGAGFVLHGDGNWSKSDDLEVGGHLLSRHLRDMAAASDNAEIRELADLKGKLPNTAAKTSEVAGGLAWVRDGWNAGFSVSRHDSRYGVPIRFSLDPAVEAEAPTIDMVQTRYDGRIEVPLNGFLEAIHMRGGYARYHHDEIEDTGEIGTSFYTRGGEFRAEAVQSENQGWSGTSGLQYVNTSVRIRGEEKYLPDARKKQTGLFTLQSLDTGALRLEGGLRYEHSRMTAKADALLGTGAQTRTFDTWSGSLGALWTVTPGWKVGVNLSRSARAPALDELFAGGPHGGTQAFEIGDPDLRPERSTGAELTLRHRGGIADFTLSAFYSRFTGFIYLAPTGEIEDDLPVYAYGQARARHYGFEAEIETAPIKAIGVDWRISAQADAVRATISGYGPAPQIPPLRMVGTLRGSSGQFDGHIGIEHAIKQDRTAAHETATPAYTLVNAGLEWHPLDNRPAVTLALTADNIFNVVARRHASLLKDYAPLSGRDIRITLRLAL
ncbi:MAG: TonB-dependent receptor [Caenibius sp.]